MAIGASGSLGTAVLRLVADATGLLAGMAAAQTAAAARAKAIGLTMTKFITLPLIGIGIAAGKMALDFEKTINNIRQLIGVPEPELQKLRGSILEMAKALPQSPKELGAAAYFILSSGIEDVDDALKVLDASARASAAGLGETEMVADAVTTVLNAYGLAAEDATRVTDLLVGAVRLGKAEPEQFAASIGRVVPVAQALGVGFDEVSASMASLTLTGLDAAESATAVRGIFTSMIKPSAGAAKVLKGVGLTMGDLRDKVKKDGLLSTLELLKDSFGGNIEEIGKLFPNVRALNGFLSLTGARAEGNAAIFDELANNVGETDEAFDKASQTAEFKLKSALSTIQVALINVGSILLPIAAEVFTVISKIVDVFNRLPKPVQNVVVAMAGVAAAAGPVILLITAMSNPILLAVVAITGLAVALQQLWTHSETFRKIVKDSMEAATAAFRQATDTIAGILNRTEGIWRNVWNAMKAYVQMTWDNIKILVKTAIGALQGVIDIVMGLIEGDWGRVWKGMKTLVSSVLTGIVSFVKTTLSGLATVALNLAKAIGHALWLGIKAGANEVKQLASHLSGLVLNAVASIAQAAYDIATSIGKAIINGIVGGLGGLVSAVGNAVKGGVKGAISLAGRALHGSGDFEFTKHAVGEKMVKGIADGVAEGTGKIKGSITKVIRDAVASAKQNVTSLGSSVAGMLGQGIDAEADRRIKALDTSPEAKRLRQIEALQKKEADTRERYALEHAVASAQDDQERAAAQQALNDWLLEQEAQALRDKLEKQRTNIQEQADARKVAAEQEIADLTDALNRGTIKQKEFNVELQKILRDSGVTYKDIGSELGTAFANGFRESLNALLDQINALSKGPVLSGSGSKPEIKKIPKPKKKMHRGGIVPGITGQEVPITAMAGELVIPRDLVDKIEKSKNRQPMAQGDRTLFGKLADSLNIYDRQDADAIIGDLGNRLALRAGALA